jgi:hypothetical protein
MVHLLEVVLADIREPDVIAPPRSKRSDEARQGLRSPNAYSSRSGGATTSSPDGISRLVTVSGSRRKIFPQGDVGFWPLSARFGAVASEPVPCPPAGDEPEADLVVLVVNGVDGDNRDFVNRSLGRDFFDADPGDRVADICEVPF